MVQERGQRRALRVALLSHSLDLDGRPRLLHNVAVILKEQGAEVTVLTPFDGSLKRLYDAADIP
eukprot:6389982-Prorocentrum_lima.AAC.1